MPKKLVQMVHGDNALYREDDGVEERKVVKILTHWTKGNLALVKYLIDIWTRKVIMS
jgi:hypothetical protein